ncbi:hypothetical protein TrLO_g10690 [Triparma laevis f. longispina]|uniref:E2F/DP family winged-helix DNA-binding domain-containing protein n=1 Tax=Triparma laevis f. longispina TaxID=1714387 RepID=A0A9W7FF76_9STRA|nr:hypothetical protein TrLO_g10690 [Triparma laevis f. longispina]
MISSAAMMSPSTGKNSGHLLLPDHTPSRVLASNVLLDMMSNPRPVDVAMMEESKKMPAQGGKSKNSSNSSTTQKKRKHNSENTAPQSYPQSHPQPQNDDLTSKSYSRASKSLGLLTLSFLSLSSPPNSSIISVDRSALQLGVERRRVYDVVNILSSLGVLERTAKNTYRNWGTGGIKEKLQEMKYQQIKISTPDENYFSWVRRGIIEEAEIECVKRAKGREELKSLGELMRTFLLLFLLSPPSCSYTLSTAASSVLGPTGESEKGGKTKVRRLYDIANVCCSLGIVTKGGERKNEFRLC